jgi:hypothetical protein
MRWGVLGMAVLAICVGPARGDTRTCQYDKDCAPWETCSTRHLCYPRDQDPAAAGTPEERAEQYRLRVGRTLASFGTFFAVLGVALVAVGEGSGIASGQSGTAVVVTGGILAGVGLVLAAVGVPLWGMAARAVKRSGSGARVSFGGNGLGVAF